MTHFERDCLKSRIVQHYMNMANRQKKILLIIFYKRKYGVEQYINIIKRNEEFDTIVDKPRPDCPRKLTTGQLTQLKRLINNKIDISLRRLSFKFKVSFKTISDQLKTIGIYYHKKRRTPKYSDEQLQEIPTRASHLYRLLSKDNFQLFMDDEKYFMLHNESIPSNCGFYTSNPSAVLPEIKFGRTQKF